MLRKNINIAKGLVNGSIGTVIKIEWMNFQKEPLIFGELPEFIEVKFDDITEPERILPISVEFDGRKGTKIQRHMLPMILCWGVTAHKMQGMTLTAAVVDLGKRNFARGQIYVAVSRVKSLVGLAISEICEKKFTKKALVDDRCTKELERLRRLSN